jgi:uncharacterized protein
MTPISFTQKFYSAPSFAPVPNNQAYKTPAGSSQLQKEYIDLVSRVEYFAIENAEKISPSLSIRSTVEIQAGFSDLKNHISNSDGEFFGTHKEVIYGPGMEMFNELDVLLNNNTISLQKRMNAVVMMAPAMGMCSGGVLTALQNAVSTLRHTGSGIQGAAYRTKIQMMESLVLQHVRDTHHGYRPGNEVHFVNAYFNFIAKDMGVPERIDQFTRIVETDISPSDFQRCREMVLTKINPNALTKVMASNYLDQVKGAQQVDVSQAVGEDDLTDVFKRTHNVKQATLSSEFGEVPDSSYLLPVPDTYSYQFARQPTLIAKHFMETLKEESIVNYDEVVTLHRDIENDSIKMLGDIFWRDRGGDCEELSVPELLSISPHHISRALDDAGVSLAEQGFIYIGIAQHLLDSRETEKIEAIPEAWLAKFSDLFERGAIPEAKIDPVAQLAAHFGCAETLRTLIRNGACIDRKDAHGWSPLMLAAREGHVNNLIALIQAGANLALKDSQGRTALEIATQAGQASAVRVLRAALAPQETLMAYTQDGRVETIQALLPLIPHVEINLNALHPTGKSALMRAAQSGHLDVLRTLLQAGADPDVQNREGEAALHFAGSLQMLRALIDGGANPSVRTRRGMTAATTATWHRSIEKLVVLIEARADLRIRSRGETPLDIARKMAHVSPPLAALLGQRLASQSQLSDAIVKVLEDGVRTPWPGETTLMQCVRRGHAQSVRAFAQHGKLLNAQNQNGMTASMLAATSGRLDTLIALIDAKPDLTLRNDQGDTAAMIGQKSGNSAIASIVLQAATQASETGDTPLMLCVSQGHTAAVQALIQHSTMDINAQNSSGMSALMVAAENGHLKALSALVDGGADINLQCAGGYSALMLAAQAGHVDALAVLIRAKADVSIKNDQGQRADEVAQSRQHRAAFEMLDAARRETVRQGDAATRPAW